MDGQYQLLNTLSKDEVDKIKCYKKKTPDGRLLSMAECKDAFYEFLKYLWKIMLDICQDKIKEECDIKEHPGLFDPMNYLDLSVTEYVCLHFPEDKCADHSVILPPTNDFRGDKRKVVERMINVSQKPDKWFFKNSKLTRGENYYNYNTANVNQNQTVADLEKDSFYIECMDCIETGEGDWSKVEVCGNCIFSEKCVKEGM